MDKKLAEDFSNYLNSILDQYNRLGEMKESVRTGSLFQSRVALTRGQLFL